MPEYNNNNNSTIISQAVDAATKMAEKSTMNSRHGCVAVYFKGKKRGEIFTSSYNHWSDRVNSSSKDCFRRYPNKGRKYKMVKQHPRRNDLLSPNTEASS